MGIITKSEITLNNVNDAYSVSLTNPSCVINADYDGSNPKLDNAFTDISINMGSAPVNFTCEEVSSEGFESEITQLSNSLIRVRIKNISTASLGGYNEYKLETVDGYSTVVKFSYTVVRESTMLDWIQDWNNNKTEIGGSYVITPKLFIGKKETLESENGEYNALTGVYIGPSGALGDSAGIYGYKDGERIFYIDENEASIACWGFDSESLWLGDKNNTYGEYTYTSDSITIGTNGLRGYLWRFENDGSGALAGGHIEWTSEGNCYIAGWSVDSIKISTDNIELRSDANAGIYGYDISKNEIFHINKESAFIAGWNFDNEAFWRGNKCDMSGSFTTNVGHVTIGSNGLRGKTWRLDNNGSGALANGNINWDNNGNSNIAGWFLGEDKLATDQICFNSFDGASGLYISAHTDASFKTRVFGFENFIDNNGGIYINVNDEGAELAGYDNNGKKIFKLKTDEASSIAGWSFDKDDLYTGTKVTTGFAKSEDITLGPSGIRGHKWRFENDGSGALAGGHISWDSNGNIVFSDDVKLMWQNTYIDKDGVYTGTVSANNITAGTISTANIKNQTGSWELNQDGTGQLANGNITWEADGSLKLNGEITAKTGNIGKFQISNNGLYYGQESNWASSSNNDDIALMQPGTILLQRSCMYGSSLTAKVKVGIGEQSDPNSNNDYGKCECAAYFYRRANSGTSGMYLPAVKIISDNVYNRDVALYTEGAIVCHGGMLANGYFMNGDDVTVLDFSFGTTVLIVNNEYRYIYLPLLSTMKKVLNTTKSFIVPITLVAQCSNSENFVLKFQSGDSSVHFLNNNGGQLGTEISVGKGDVLQLLLIWDSSNYYAQLVLRAM